MKRNILIWIAIGFGAIFVGFFLVQIYHPGPDLGVPQSFISPSVSPSSPTDQSPSVTKTLAPQAKKESQSTPMTQVSSKEFVEEFRDRFGANLDFEFLTSGRLLAIHGGMGQGVFAEGDYRPDHAEQVRARAKRILSFAEPALGIQRDWPLQETDFQGSTISAHISWNQTHDGLRVVPVGTVKIDLGPKGELLALYSDYAPQVNVENVSKLTAAQALAQAALPGMNLKEGNREDFPAEKVIWIQGGQGKIAYQYQIHGEQVVIDAQTGEVILRRDRKRF